MTLVPHTLTALSRQDIPDEPQNRNVVIGAVVTCQTPEGATVTMFDDASGANGSTSKQTGANGQVTVFVEPGEYTFFVNGRANKAVVAPRNPVTSVPSVDALRLRRGRFDGEAVQLVSYYEGANKGGGLLVWDATSEVDDDGVNCVKVAGVSAGRWLLQRKGFVDQPANYIDHPPPMQAGYWSQERVTLFKGSRDTSSTNRVVFNQIFKWGSGYAALAQMRQSDGPANNQMTGLFFSDDLVNWRESAENPIFNSIVSDWQGPRAMGQALVWDHQQEKWALIFNGNNGDAIPGPATNGIGIAFSDNLKRDSWSVNPVPVMEVSKTGLGVFDWAPNATSMFCTGLHYTEGYWYMFVVVGSPSPDPWVTALFRAETLTSAWEGVPQNPILTPTGGWEGRFTEGVGPFQHGGAWYMPYKSITGGETRIGMARSKSGILGPWEKSPEPVITTTVETDRGVLIPFSNRWYFFSSSNSLSGEGGDEVFYYAERVSGRVEKSFDVNTNTIDRIGFRNRIIKYPDGTAQIDVRVRCDNRDGFFRLDTDHIWGDVFIDNDINVQATMTETVSLQEVDVRNLTGPFTQLIGSTGCRVRIRHSDEASVQFVTGDFVDVDLRVTGYWMRKRNGFN